MRVERRDEARDGAPTEADLRRELEALGFTVSAYTYPPGMRFDEHSHGVDKIDAVVSGRFRIEMEGDAVVLEAGDMVWVPRGLLHAAEVVGDAPVRSLDAVRG